MRVNIYVEQGCKAIARGVELYDAVDAEKKAEARAELEKAGRYWTDADTLLVAVKRS